MMTVGATAKYSPHYHTAAGLEFVLFTDVRVRVVVQVRAVLRLESVGCILQLPLTVYMLKSNTLYSNQDKLHICYTMEYVLSAPLLYFTHIT